MRAMACAAAVLMFALTAACKDRDRDGTANRIDNAAEEAGEDAREAADDAGDAVDEAADDAGKTADNAVKAADDAADDARASSYERRDEFRRDVRERLARMDAELAELERGTKKGVDQTRDAAIVTARNSRRAVDRTVERLGTATASTWDELKLRVSESLDSADRQLRALRSDAKPMGGTGGPS